MLLKNIPREKWPKYASIFIGFGSMCIAIEIIIHQFINPTFFWGFFEGIITGLGTVFNIYGMYLFRKTKRPDLIPSHQNSVLEM